jgi:hypothetical protein
VSCFAVSEVNCCGSYLEGSGDRGGKNTEIIGGFLIFGVMEWGGFGVGKRVQ